MPIYSVTTDAFQMDDFEAGSLDEAIAEAFEGEIRGVKDEESLLRKFQRYVSDGEVVLKIGEC